MGYTISWGNQSVCIDYFGEIDNDEIKNAHYKLNGDERFYDCKWLILDISNCNMDKVSVDELEFSIIPTDYGASLTLKSLKVAMIAVIPQNINKARQYIDKCQKMEYPWEFKLFSSIDDANRWLDF